MPDTGDLLAFCRVVDLGSMTTAGRALGESKATVSRRVARLEELLGTPLLRRDGRSVSPTEEGRLYREKAGVALEVLGVAAESLRAVHASPSGLLRVTAPLGLPGALLRPILPGFLATYPDIRVELVLTEAVLSFREHQVDVAFRFAQTLPDSSLIAHPLDTLVAVLVAAPAYVARRGTPAHPNELPAYDVMTAPVEEVRTLRFQPEDGGSPVTVSVPGRVLTHDFLFTHDLALAGAGITVAPLRLVEPDLRAGRLVHVLPNWRLLSSARLYLIHAGGLLPPKVRAFRDYVRTALAAQPCP
jgi:DNA-binding transcriptional LysR family regulator